MTATPYLVWEPGVPELVWAVRQGVAQESTVKEKAVRHLPEVNNAKL